MNNDLISREALKEKAETVTLWNGDVRRFVSYETIDNAPTVEQPTADYVCEKCKYVDRSVHEFPCNECAYAYENHFTEVKGGETNEM